MSDLLSPPEIAAWLRDAGRLTPSEAHTLEQRITAWANSRHAQGVPEGIAQAHQTAQAVIAHIRRATERAGAERVLAAIRKLMPVSDDYERGYRDGTATTRQSYPNTRQRYPRKKRSRRDGK